MFIQCLKHNYSGTSIVCPECFQEQQDRRYKVEITNEAMKIINKANELREKRLENYKILLEAEKRLAAYNQRRYEAGDELISEIENVYPEITNWPPFKELQKIIQEGSPK